MTMGKSHILPTFMYNKGNMKNAKKKKNVRKQFENYKMLAKY